MRRVLALLTLAAIMNACASRVHTLESTQNLSRNELLAMCEDLAVRAEQDCQWNIEQRQSDLSNQQTWEINCRARRDSARESYDNVCQSSRFRTSAVTRE